MCEFFQKTIQHFCNETGLYLNRFIRENFGGEIQIQHFEKKSTNIRIFKKIRQYFSNETGLFPNRFILKTSNKINLNLRAVTMRIFQKMNYKFCNETGSFVKILV